MANSYRYQDSYGDDHQIRASLQSPAISLMIVAGVAIPACLVGLAIDVVLLASGALERLEQMNPGGSRNTLKSSCDPFGE